MESTQNAMNGSACHSHIYQKWGSLCNAPTMGHRLSQKETDEVGRVLCQGTHKA